MPSLFLKVGGSVTVVFSSCAGARESNGVLPPSRPVSLMSLTMAVLPRLPTPTAAITPNTVRPKASTLQGIQPPSLRGRRNWSRTALHKNGV